MTFPGQEFPDFRQEGFSGGCGRRGGGEDRKLWSWGPGFPSWTHIGFWQLWVDVRTSLSLGLRLRRVEMMNSPLPVGVLQG